MVRIFCLTSITRIPVQPDAHEILPYDDVNERLWYSEKEEINHALYDMIADKAGRRLTCNVFSKPPYPYPKKPEEIPPDHEPSNLSDYKLTEICIGWKYFNGEKVFVMNLFRDDTDTIKIKMVRGAVKFIENKLFPLKDAFDLMIATSNLYANYELVKNFDIIVKVRCIKNTKERNINETEEKLYDNFAKRLQHISKAELIKNPLILPNQSEANVLRTKISDISILIKLLCDPQNGSVRNVLETAGEQKKRYCQQLSLYLKNVDQIRFENMNIFDITLQELLHEINLMNLRSLRMNNCNIAKLSRKFLNLLPERIEEINFSNNNIKFITQPISRLLHLKELILYGNKYLSDLPWSDLPPNIEILNIANTNVLIIPKEICKLTKLKDFTGNFHSICWSSLNSSIMFLHIEDTKEPITDILLSDKCNLRRLSIINAGITEIDCTKLNRNLGLLNLKSNHIKHFDCKNVFTNLTSLTLQTETLCWKTLPSTIVYLELFNISFIPNDISKFTKLWSLRVDSKNISHVSWSSISPSVCSLEIKGGEKLNEISFIKEGIEIIQKSSIKWLDISSCGLTNIECKKLPSRIEKLKLENNKLKMLDPENLPELNLLKLGNNVIKRIIWKNLPPTLDTIDVQNNQLTSIEDISHLPKIRIIIANKNKISKLCFARNDWNLYFQHLYEIDLGTNELSYLPIGFENLRLLTKLHLNNNRFDYNDGNLKEKLWDRLPKNVLNLNLNFNNLHRLPCYLKHLRVKKLEVVNCKLTKICSRIISPELHLDIRQNEKIQSIPYIPNTISKHIVASENSMNDKMSNLILDNRDLINISTHKIKYDFKEFEEESSTLACKCCVRCGRETIEKFVKQLFTMDLNMILELENGVNKEYPKEKWRSNSVIRLCQKCLLAVKEIAVSEEFKTLLQLKTVAIPTTKKRIKKPIPSNSVTFTKVQCQEGERPYNILSNVPFYRLPLNQFYHHDFQHSNQINAIALYGTVPYSDVEISDTNERLPSIEYVYSHRNSEPQQHWNNANYNDNTLHHHNQQATDPLQQNLIPTTNADNYLHLMYTEPFIDDNSSERNYNYTQSSNNVLYSSSDNNFDSRFL